MESAYAYETDDSAILNLNIYAQTELDSLITFGSSRIFLESQVRHDVVHLMTFKFEFNFINGFESKDLS